MIHCLSRLVLVVVAVVAPALGASQPAAAEGRSDLRLSAPGRFSPNGDGVKDGLTITLRVAREMPVRLEIGPASERTIDRRVDLGVLAKGTHTWTWNGRNQSGKLVSDRTYRIRAFVDDSQGGYLAQDRVQVDTRFDAALTAPIYGAEPGAAARVYPRTSVVTDVLPLTALSYEKKLVDLELVIRSSRGRVVRRADVAEVLSTVNGGTYGHGRTVEWAAVRGGRPLPAGRYSAVVTGLDRAGNSGRSRRVRIWVSSDKLVWKEASTTVSPAESEFGPCDWSTANGCGDYPPCGTVVPSGLYAGGLSYRAAACATPDPDRELAVGRHLLEVPDATGVRGLAAARVAFTGTPTTAGENDTGTLTVWTSGDDDPSVTGTAGQSAWADHPSWGAGLTADDVLSQRDPAVAWSYVTRGTDSVDLASFTVDVRYLAVAR